MSKDCKLKRKVWTINETKGFLKCYAARKDEFSNPRKKRNAYKLVLEDMIARGYTDTNTTSLALEGKMRTLLEAYKSVKSNEKRNCGGASMAHFYEQMEDIFGDSSGAANPLTLDFGFDSASPLAILPSNEDCSTVDSEESIPFIKLNPDSPATSTNERTEQASTSKKRKSPQEAYYEAKLELKKAMYDKKLALQKEFHDSTLKLLAESEKQKQNLLKQLLIHDNLFLLPDVNTIT